MKKVVSAQYRKIIELAISSNQWVIPKEGWLRSVRKALEMSGAQLAKRMKVTRALISRNEEAELEGKLTLATMKNMAEAMSCRFVYAIVPTESIDDLRYQQAVLKATAIVNKTNVHMALEQQLLSKEQIQAEIKRLALEMLAQSHRDFWNID